MCSVTSPPLCPLKNSLAKTNAWKLWPMNFRHLHSAPLALAKSKCNSLAVGGGEAFQKQSTTTVQQYTRGSKPGSKHASKSFKSDISTHGSKPALLQSHAFVPIFLNKLNRPAEGDSQVDHYAEGVCCYWPLTIVSALLVLFSVFGAPLLPFPALPRPFWGHFSRCCFGAKAPSGFSWVLAELVSAPPPLLLILVLPAESPVPLILWVAPVALAGLELSESLSLAGSFLPAPLPPGPSSCRFRLVGDLFLGGAPLPPPRLPRREPTPVSDPRR